VLRGGTGVWLGGTRCVTRRGHRESAPFEKLTRQAFVQSPVSLGRGGGAAITKKQIREEPRLNFIGD